ncbi:MAG: hypothetical protein ACKVZ6_07060 [Kineosporiaceae bacterium]|jgi:hypothetical protein
MPRGRTDEPRRDEGVALLTVLGTMAIVTLFLLTSLGYVLGQSPVAREDQDAKAAQAAAQAGVDEYVARLTANDSYWTLGNTDTANPAFAAGRTIQGSGGKAASYRYQVLSTAALTARDGTIRLQATGTSSPGNGTTPVSRTLTATLQPKGFLRYIYFSDVEVLDPELFYSFTYVTMSGSSYWNSGTYGTRYRYVDLGPGVRQACGAYYYAGRSTPAFTASSSTPVTVWDTTTNAATSTTVTSGTASGFSCVEIQWASGDIVAGPLHSNDALRVGGSPLFTDPVTESSWTNPPDPARRWWSSGTPSTGTTAQPGYWPVYAAPLAMPNGNSELLKYVEPRVDDVTAAPGPGCYYTGQTRIVFQGTTMRVLSPSTTSAPSRCLDVASRNTEQTKAIPPVIYVDSTSASCTYGALGYPIAGEWLGGVTTDYSCTRGTVFVSGTVGGQVTVASKDDVVVTGDLLTADGATGTDMIGLVAGNYVWVYHPVDGSGGHNNLLSSGATPRTLHAAILSLRHSFIVQNWQYGAALSTTTTNKLTVLGSISQRYRGPVGTGNSSGPVSGYIKNYLYDQRLRNLQPPYFLKPDATPWQVVTVTDG